LYAERSGESVSSKIMLEGRDSALRSAYNLLVNVRTGSYHLFETRCDRSFTFKLASDIIDGIFDRPLGTANRTFDIAFSLIDLAFHLPCLSLGLLVNVAGCAAYTFLDLAGYLFGFTFNSIA
jgi:hypothetical protein